MATAVPAVTPKDAPKYMLVSRFCCLTRSLKKKSINSYSGYCMYLVLSFLKHFNSFILPFKEHVKQRIRDTYMYFGASLGVTAGTAVAIFRSPAMMNIVARQGMVAMGVSIAAMIGSGMLVRSIPYQEGFGSKQMAWLLHSAVVGAVVAPIMLLGGPILTR